MAKELYFPRQVDLNYVVNSLVSQLSSEGYKVQSNVGTTMAVVQAKKEGFLRTLVAANRAFTFTFNNTVNGLQVKIGIGAWVENLAATAIETVILGPIFLVVDVPEMVYNEHIEGKFARMIENIVNQAPSSFQQAPPPFQPPQSVPQYQPMPQQPQASHQQFSYCPSCGGQIAPNYKFCPSCGTRLS
ncbi:hypothetical protein HS1genome_0225 [Sulfodiicoccus acidiphilus]|uniref:Zinc-ribbon domain-containing protein n=1 Tax=Sulfodiicoccus acidiphilus TaxID=1670455 RepID=A0A348B0Y4_9CREN|nr:zinc ribbon domain-containing protein [Sulfodiicoccus acidiphilus]BBD71836.1 hypothetical protein HS1genome_0225 [Sulfodiicoccus acidiphilus]GGU02365.1 hypothetical protein GCM10007116_19260 [Sulfodiicoccus acidiphilus]